LPALRERTDIRALVTKLTDCEAAGRTSPVSYTEGAMAAIEDYGWPGNIRQLVNVIRVAIALLDDDETQITESHLPEELFEAAPHPAVDGAAETVPCSAPVETAGSLEEINRQVVVRALESAGGNISAAARQLGISRNTLYRKLGRM
jgi:transcriptional regulator of acetoin/glycerol metabolism